MSRYLKLTRAVSFRPFPLFGELLQGDPYIFDFTAANPRVAEYVTDDYETFQAQIFADLGTSGKSWGLGNYLEDRTALLHRFPQMIEEGRVIHAGLDIIVQAGEALHAPLDATVHATGVDAGLGNYGGYVVLRHELEAVRFFSFYGHLNSAFQVEVGQALTAGTSFAITGEGADTGHWFSHTHLQILTERAMDELRMLQGYVQPSEVPELGALFPTPYPMFRVD
jgi:murein DD-endopeptidase MepM/ murein hydrolase activator NlpD